MDPKLERAIALAKLGRKDRARDVCIDYLEGRPNDVAGWVVLAQVVGDRNMAIYCLEQILDIKPTTPGPPSTWAD
jgi:predicted Zn-dependent protease